MAGRLDAERSPRRRWIPPQCNRIGRQRSTSFTPAMATLFVLIIPSGNATALGRKSHCLYHFRWKNVYLPNISPQTEMGIVGTNGVHQGCLAKKMGGCHSNIRVMAHNLETVFCEESFSTGNSINSTLPSQAVGNFLEVYEFLCRFQEVLGMEMPFSLEELETQLLYPWSDSSLKEDAEENCHDLSNFVVGSGLILSSILETTKVNHSICMHNKLTLVQRTLIQDLINLILDKILLRVNRTSDSQVSKPNRGRRNYSSNRKTTKGIKFDMLPINQLIFPEVARRYVLAYLITEGKVACGDTAFRKNSKVIRLLQGDGSVFDSSLAGVVGVDMDSMLLGRVIDNVYGKLKRQKNVSSESKGDSVYKCCLDSNGSVPEWVKVLDPVRKLPTNVGAKIRNRIREALEKNPPEWAKELLEDSISKEIYKGNAAGPTKRAVVAVLDKVSDGSGGVIQEPIREETTKRIALISNIVMKKCRIVLRRVAASDHNKVFCDLVGRNFMNSDDSDVKVVFGSTSSRPLDLRTIDLRLLHDAYGGSHEAFLEDIREHLRTNVRMAQMNRPSLAQLAEKLSNDFELRYKEEVAPLFMRLFEYMDGKSTVEAEKELEELLNSLKIPEAPWETGICKVCGLNKDDELVLLCDTEACNAPYHTYCLHPPLSRVPDGNWYCPSCKQLDDNDLAGPHQVYQFVNERWADASQIFDLATVLEETEYWELGAEKRTFMLKFLCDQSLSLPLLRRDIDKSGAKLARVLQKFKALNAREENLAAKVVEVRKSSRKGKKRGFASNIDEDPSEDVQTLSDTENSNSSFSNDHPVEQLSKLSVRREFLGTDSLGRLYWGFPDMSTHHGILVNENLDSKDNNGTWRLFQSYEEISTLIEYLRTNDPEKKELRDFILHWQNSMLQPGQQTGSHVVCSADMNSSFIDDLYPKATALLVDNHLKKSSRKNRRPKLRRCECLELILPCGYHCVKCHETFYTKIEFEQHKESSCGLSSSLEKSKVEIGIRNFSIPEASLKPVVGKALHVLRQLKINLLDIEAALPDGSRRASRASSEWRSAWCAYVKSADTIYEMVEATIVLETMIRTEYISNTWWWYWSSVAAAAKTATLSALALRIYTLDAAIDYQKVNTSSAVQQSRKRKEVVEPPKKKAPKKSRSGKEFNDAS